MNHCQEVECRQVDQSSGVVISLKLLVICCLFGGLLTGCVSSGKYEAEKARALNFQRLLAQEEKRTGELNTQVQEVKRQTASLEAQNRDLTTELEALRDQMSRQQESLPSPGSEPTSLDLTPSNDLTLSEDSLSEFGLSDLSFDESDFKDVGGGSSEPGYYTVARGDTLFRISREYGISVNDLKDWNGLTGNIISVGQRLIVSRP